MKTCKWVLTFFVFFLIGTSLAPTDPAGASGSPQRAAGRQTAQSSTARKQGVPAWMPRYPRVRRRLDRLGTEFMTADAPAEIAAFYEQELSKRGFTVEKDLSIRTGAVMMGGSLKATDAKTGRTVEIDMIVTGPGSTQVALSFEADGRRPDRTATPASAPGHKTPAWPALPPKFLPGYGLDPAELSKLPVGDKIALPFPDGFHTITVTAPLKDGVLGIKDMKETVKDVKGTTITLTVRSLYTHAYDAGQVGLVRHVLTAQPDGGSILEMAGAYEAGKLVGYRFDLAALGSLTAGSRIAILDPTGWRVVTVDAPLKAGVLGVEDFTANGETVKDLRLLDPRDGKAGLVWKVGN